MLGNAAVGEVKDYSRELLEYYDELNTADEE